MHDLLDDVAWSCVGTAPGAFDAAELSELEHLDWLGVRVPGTAADALRAAGHEDFVGHDYDGEDWWFRCRFRGEPGDWTLHVDGLATMADVWLNGRHLARSENMFVNFSVEVGDLETDNELLIRCGALYASEPKGRPRPRWKTAQVEQQSLRWIRSTLLGRIPGWANTPRVVGPWRPVRLTRVDALGEAEVHLRTACVGTGGRVDATVTMRATDDLRQTPVRLGCLDREVPLDVVEDSDGTIVLRASLHLAEVERWWPHTHGGQPLYPVFLRRADQERLLGRVGFKTVEVDQSDGGFTFVVNGVSIFVRGANWFPPDPVRFASEQPELEDRVQMARAANLNMLRVPGTTAYVESDVLDACDELGLLVWQDCMFAYMDYPDDESFLASARAEVRQALADLARHPALAVVCGNQEVEEIAAMSGVSAHSFGSELFEKVLPALAGELVPEAVFVGSNPSGGEPSYRPDTGVSQYFGIGGYLRGLDQLRGDRVRFAVECLCFATPPEPEAMDRFGGANLAVHDPRWKRALHQDAGRSWDMDDLRAHYMHEVFGVDAFRERYMDAERALDLGRATNAHLVEYVFSDWRCSQPTSGGGLILGLNDVALGAGWGLLDVDGNPKAPYFTLRRASAPLCLRFEDRGLNGLYAHVFNEGPTPLRATVSVDLFSNGETLADQAECEVEVAPRASETIHVNELFSGFYDLNYAYKFGPPKYDVVAGRLVVDGETRSDDVFLPLGQGRNREADVGLTATWVSAEDGATLSISTQRFAQWVSVVTPGFRPSDSWFHLSPNSKRSITLQARGGSRPPRGRVRSINSVTEAVIRPAEAQ